MKNEITSAQALALLDQQLREWELACAHYAALNHVKVKELLIGASRFILQYNPARIRSSAARIDAHALQSRKCFLCPPQLPPGQRLLPFGEAYALMVNPYPIFPQHFTIPVQAHVPQQIAGRYGDMLDMARCLDRFVLFYNGPRCGASAPDHAHFQAGNKGFLPIEQTWKPVARALSVADKRIRLYALYPFLRNALVIETACKAASEEMFGQVYRLLEKKEGDEEPMMNLLVWFDHGKWLTFIFPRARHRPSCYGDTGEGALLFSPASVDMGGVLILPREEDFNKITALQVEEALKEVCLPNAAMEKLIADIR